MKAIGSLFDRIARYDNVCVAAWRAAQGKRGRQEVVAFFERLEAEISGIVQALRDGSFQFQEYRNFAIRDPKTRTIHAPSFRDRVVHHAIIAVTGPVFECGAGPHSYACRAGRGQHAALAQARAWMRRGDWFLKVDVAKYYDSIPHELLRQRLARRFRESRLLALFGRLLDSYATVAGHGLPIGALTSQYLGNFYLDACDHWISQELRIPRSLRYMDDFLLLADYTALLRAREGLAAQLAGRGLRMKDGGVINRCSSGVPFLGFVLYPDRTRLNRLGRKRLRRKLKTTEKKWERGELATGELSARALSLFAHARTGDDVAWRRMVCRFSKFGETPGPATRDARRLVEQHGEELPLRDPQQEEARQPQQESGLPPCFGPRHGGADPPPDDASSRAPALRIPMARDETKGKSPPSAERCSRTGSAKAAGGAPLLQPDLL